MHIKIKKTYKHLIHSSDKHMSISTNAVYKNLSTHIQEKSAYLFELFI